MNLILFSADELENNTQLRVDVARAEHLLAGNKILPGAMLRVGQKGGSLGTGRVLQVGSDYLILDVVLDAEPSQLPVVDLILALPRPQMLKRIFQTVACMGVRKLFLVGSERVEKSYFSSSALESDSIAKHLHLGLEQGMITQLPEVYIESKLHNFLQSWRTENFKHCLIADARADGALNTVVSSSGLIASEDVAIAIGPEGGWRLNELRSFQQLGFSEFSLGKSVLSVEVAVAVVLGQLQLMRELTSQVKDN